MGITKTFEQELLGLNFDVDCAVYKNCRMTPPSEIKPAYPILLIRGEEMPDSYLDSIERFEKEAAAMDIEYQILDYPGGELWYKYQDTPESRQIIQRIIGFFTEHLLR